MLRAHILGTSSAVPAFGRHPSAQILEHNDRYLLIDCGEATQFQLQKYKFRLRRLDAIFISHLHGDHVYGLPGLLASMSMGSRTAALSLIGPAGLAQFVRQALKATDSNLSYQLDFHELSPNTTFRAYEKRGLEVLAFPLKHRVTTFGYRFQEQPKARRFLVERAQALDIPSKFFRLLKQENSVKLKDGRTIEPNDVLGDRPPSFSYAYCSDTIFHRPILDHIHRVDGLYHEATFLHELLSRAKIHQTHDSQTGGYHRPRSTGRAADFGALFCPIPQT